MLRRLIVVASLSACSPSGGTPDKPAADPSARKDTPADPALANQQPGKADPPSSRDEPPAKKLPDPEGPPPEVVPKPDEPPKEPLHLDPPETEPAKDHAPAVATTFAEEKNKGTVSVGDRFAIELGSPRALSPEYMFSWGDPVVSGPAVAYVETNVRSPPPDVDGGSNTMVFVFEAKAAGKSTIRIPRQKPGPEAPAGDHSFAVTVK